jgi:hypothetical protein
MVASNNSINLNQVGIAGYDGVSTFNGSTVTQFSLLLGGANSHTIANLGVATNGQLPIGSAGANPVLATLTAGTGISITNGAGSITIAGTGGGLTWTDVTGSTQAMAVNNGYTADSGSLITFTLPSTAAFGTVMAVVGKGTGLWKIAQNSGQTIHMGITNTTTGTGGSLASNFQYDVVYLLCTVANTDFTCVQAIGNLTVT